MADLYFFTIKERRERALAAGWKVWTLFFFLANPVAVLAQEPFPILEAIYPFDAGGLGCGEISGMTRGLDGSIYVSGIGTTGNCAGTYASFVAKLTSNGSHSWTAVFTDQGRDNMTWGNPAVDGQGNAYLAVTEICCPSGTGLVAQIDPDGVLIQAVPMPESDPSQAPFVTGVAFDPVRNRIYASEDTFNFSTEDVNPLVAMFNTNLNLLGQQEYEQPFWASSEAGLGLDNAGNVYIGGFQVHGGLIPDDYLTVKWLPLLAGRDWTATETLSDPFLSEGRRVNGTAFPGGGFVIAGLEEDGGGTDFYNVRRVSAGGSFQSPATAPLEVFVPKVGTDLNGNSYVLGYSLDNFLAAMAKIKPDGTFSWDPAVFEEEEIYSFDAVHVSSDNRIYASGYLNEIIGDDEFYVAKYQSARSLTISLNPPSVSPAGKIPQTLPFSSMAGAQTRVTVTAYNAQNQPVPGAPVQLSAAPVPFSGGHDHDNGVRPTGRLVKSSGTTNQNGVLVTTYTPSQFGGYEKITAVWVGSSPVVATAELEVRVPNLMLLPEATFYIKDGGTCFHHGPATAPVCQIPDQNHYATSFTLANSTTIANLWAVEHSTYQLEMNDISLPFGGGFDIKGNWTKDTTCINPPPNCGVPGHTAHRLGKNVDIQVFPDKNPNELSQQEQFFLDTTIRANGGVNIIPESDHWHIEFRR